ncbi:galactitol-1-phosphate 5-dehydrogenase [Candidatus Epulonipiscium fishelsonii]|uniref:Galactitol-1-phosphate 5-dehydrogenase n=1 Tax=Candidatus Epulonipiscium fishelsonii TaxID=77094 RepID=A0ACC8XBY2_9FIRM|nr:galactitol-1-phosphate 5-dehydrogenase [Epulopiscium sp. SCG-B05WGA-EpuloA1]ONI40008.1 galactitol-1-phosphate 5-dehydrogenase [Epulopiscium sp. SCG-B11WGA-EpuloA1]
MKAVRYLGPSNLELQEIENPIPKDDEVLLKIRACGICGSDVHGYLGLTGRRIAPMTMGHEFAGEVIGLGDAVKNTKIGDAVVVQPINFCGECEYCLQGLTNVCLNKRFYGVLDVDGAFAEYLCVPEKLLFKMPEGMSYNVGALAEPYAVAYGATNKIDTFEGKNVLIIGAGTIGLCILQMVKLQNPRSIIVSDLSDPRLKVAKDLGATHVINPKNEDYLEIIKKYTDDKMVDVALEAVGIQVTANQAIKSVKFGGKAVWVGLSQKTVEVDMQDIVGSAKQIIGTYTYTHEELGKVVEILGSGKIEAEKLISKVIGLDETHAAIEELHNHPDNYVKIIVDPTI